MRLKAGVHQLEGLRLRIIDGQLAAVVLDRVVLRIGIVGTFFAIGWLDFIPPTSR
jgi:hypothetical protein